MKLNHPIKKLKLSMRAISKIENWGDYFLDYLGLKRGEIIYKIDGMKVKIRAGTIDKSIFTEVILGELYYPKWLELEDSPVVIDVGSHIGTFSLFISNKNNAIVYAIEPNKDNFKMLQEQIELNKLKIIPFNLALSDKKGEMKLYSGRHSARGSILREEGSEFQRIETVTLEEFFNMNKIKKCDLMKMDIEGGEYLVLYSTPKRIFEKIKRIFLELHSIEGENKGKMIEFLKQMGFKLEYDKDNFIYAIKN
jgi:FkbM family methyltransferase